MQPNLDTLLKGAQTRPMAISLFRDGAWPKLVQSASGLPCPHVGYLFLELELASTKSEVDLSVSIHHPSDVQLMSQYLVDKKPSAPTQQSATWDHLLHWMSTVGMSVGPGSPMPQFGWEFDLSRSHQHELGLPSLFIQAPGHEASMSNDTYQKHLVDDIVRPMCHFDLSPKMQATLQSCWTALPQESMIFMIGVMLPRAIQAVRLNVTGMSYPDLKHYLQAIGYPGNIECLHALLLEIAPLMSTFVVALDVAEGIGPRLGIEFFDPLGGPINDWKPLLGFLVDQGFCTDEERQGLLDWESLIPLQEARWPAHWVTMRDELGTPFWRPFLQRRLNHVKLVFEEDRWTQCKAYLGLNSLWYHELTSQWTLDPR